MFWDSALNPQLLLKWYLQFNSVYICSMKNTCASFLAGCDFRCTSDDLCLTEDQVCNGIRDCSDGSDESDQCGECMILCTCNQWSCETLSTVVITVHHQVQVEQCVTHHLVHASYISQMSCGVSQRKVQISLIGRRAC